MIYGTRRLNAAFTRAVQQFLSRTESIKFRILGCLHQQLFEFLANVHTPRVSRLSTGKGDEVKLEADLEESTSWLRKVQKVLRPIIASKGIPVLHHVELELPVSLATGVFES